MKIALIGYGAMGKLIERLAAERGHTVAVVIEGSDASAAAAELAAKLAGCDAAIDFSSAEAVVRNAEACVLSGVPLVEGTTGWNDRRGEVERLVVDGNGAFIFGANFSIGVNLFYRVAAHAVELFAKFPEYEVFIEEQHHSRKKDAPSGTALKLKDLVAEKINGDISVTSTRAGSIPGTHRLGFDGPADQVLLEHTARSREGFAIGALLAAEWIQGRKGFYEFGEVLSEVLRDRTAE
jgi:4-hydroxy-tetrahydrodipicolinate reductase